jgi:hypothetical protein
LNRRKTILARWKWLVIEEVRFSLTGMAWNGGSRFWWTGMFWNGRSGFCPDWNSLEWRKWALARLEWLGIEEVGLSQTEIV